MAIIRSYNQPTVDARPAPNAQVPANASVGAFGNAAQTEGNARAWQLANLEELCEGPIAHSDLGDTSGPYQRLRRTASFAPCQVFTLTTRQE